MIFCQRHDQLDALLVLLQRVLNIGKRMQNRRILPGDPTGYVGDARAILGAWA